MKASRFLTHVRRLRDPRDSVRRLLDGATRLGAHLGPILVQLPPDMPAEPGRLAETLDAFPRNVRVAVEPRHDSWFSEEVRDILRERNAALCWADRRGPRTPVTADWATADWGYVRFHAGRSLPPGCYGERALATWLERVTDAWPRPARRLPLLEQRRARVCAPGRGNVRCAGSASPPRGVAHAEPRSLPVG